jgi:2-polyprenyl-6-methoxyphenol hydroxylase-like FAD-dependent oxidoreductase
VTRTALIVGAGIGGLSAGIALRRAGWRIQIFERAGSPRELGFGVGLAPNAIAALRELGVADVVLARGFEPRRGELRRLDGTVLKRAGLPPGALRGPMIIALRPALHGALLDAVGSESIVLGADILGFNAADGRVSIQTAAGAVAEGDLLIGADGINSVIRRQLHPGERPPRTSGLVAVRGAVHGALHHLGERDGILYFGRGVEAMVGRASGTGIYWYLSMAASLVPAGLRDPKAVLSHMSPHLDPTFLAVASATDDLRFDELVDRDPTTSWGTGITTLLGDAAHPMLPHTGQGAAQAIVDAVALAKTLAADDNIERAIRSYERDRIGKTAALVRQGRRTARIMGTTNGTACALRDTIIRMMPVQSFVRFYARINRRAGTAGSGAIR